MPGVGAKAQWSALAVVADDELGNHRGQLSKAEWTCGCVSTVDSNGRTVWIVDAHRDDGRRYFVHADEKLSAFVELERQVSTVTFYLESIHADSCR